MSCPDENVLSAFARGDLDPDQRASLEAHIDECDVCLELVSELTRVFASAFEGGELPPEPEHASESGSTPSHASMEATLQEGAATGGGQTWGPALRLPEGARLGRYVVLRAIGAGAMGIVYAAYDPELDRKIALKLLRADPAEASRDTHSDRNKRMLREAQALARLSHPGVITVHDVGTFEDQVFIAMEFVEGGTLTDWLRARRRSHREVLEVFRQAGEGLAAAHDAGLVHRDFKPDNVLLHSDGRAVVTDFGLARPVSREAETDRTLEISAVSASIRASGSGSALSETLTQTGALVGTPAYMAPEQLDGRRSDAKADQFGFCVALYEGLYGSRPFKARDLPTLVAAVFQGQVEPPPRDRNVPRWLRKAVLRGLKVEPDQRHSSMRALLADLRPSGLGSWRGVAAIAVLGAAAGASTVAMSTTTSTDAVAYCDDVRSKLEGVWDETARDELRASFEATKLPFAADTATRVSGVFDAYAEQWVDVQTEACRSGVEGTEPEAVVARRMSCLTRRRRTLGTMVGVLREADTTTVMASLEAVQQLPSLVPCLDASSLGDELPPIPEDEAEAVEDIRTALDEAIAKQIVGHLQDAVASAETAFRLAEGVSYGPVKAEAAAGLAEALVLAGQPERAEEMAHLALQQGVAHHHREIVAEASASLSDLEATRGGPPAIIERWTGLGMAALEALEGRRPVLRAELMSSLSNAKRRAGKLDEAAAIGHELLTLREELSGKDHYSMAEPLSELGKTYARMGDHAQSVRMLDRAREILLDTYGEKHPHYAALLQNLATTHFVHGQYRDALTIYQESQDLLRTVLGERHPSVGILSYNIATTFIFLERYDEALAQAQLAQSLENEVHGPDSLVTAMSWALVGEIHLRAGRYEQAEDALRKALARAKANDPSDRGRQANYNSQLGLTLLRAGRVQEAHDVLQAALAVQRQTSGEPSIEVAETSGRLAMVMLAKGQLEEARKLIDTSVTQYESEDHDPHQHAEAWFRRARIMAAASDTTAARTEAERARQAYIGLDDQPSRIRAIEHWLANLAPSTPTP
ncbi:MAG: tetratricopeptide repeat protein [Myxococcota bacterium]